MKRKPEFFVWREAFALGIPGVDAEHRQFFEIMNRCARAASEGASTTTVQATLQELATYARFHFRHEEEALDRVGYPELEDQRQEHQRFVRALERLLAMEDPGILAPLALARDWLVEHVTGSDRRYVAWITRERPQRAFWGGDARPRVW